MTYKIYKIYIVILPHSHTLTPHPALVTLGPPPVPGNVALLAAHWLDNERTGYLSITPLLTADQVSGAGSVHALDNATTSLRLPMTSYDFLLLLVSPARA